MPSREESIRLARRAVVDVIVDLVRIEHRLFEIAESVPPPWDSDAMADDRIPPDQGFALAGAVACAPTEDVAELISVLRKAAAINDEYLHQSFLHRQASTT